MVIGQFLLALFVEKKNMFVLNIAYETLSTL